MVRVSVELVSPEGELVRASDDENADLFWGVRGGGGNVGVVISFEFKARPLGPIIMCGAPIYPLEAAEEIFLKWRDWTATVPEEGEEILQPIREFGEHTVTFSLEGDLMYSRRTRSTGTASRVDMALVGYPRRARPCVPRGRNSCPGLGRPRSSACSALARSLAA